MRNIQVFGRRLGALFLFATVLYAELPPLPPQNYQQPVVISPGLITPGVMSSGNQAPAQAPTPRPLTLQGNPRYGAEAADYNTEQRKQWLEKCEPLREVDFAGFRKCFEVEKKKSTDGIKRRFRDVEARQGQPFRNVGPDPAAMDAPTKNPAFDVEVEKN